MRATYAIFCPPLRCYNNDILQDYEKGYTIERVSDIGIGETYKSLRFDFVQSRSRV